MKTLRGRVRDVGIARQDSLSTVYALTLEVGGTARQLEVSIPPGRPTVEPGDALEVKIRQSPAGDDVVVCRNVESGAVLVDTTPYEGTTRLLWLLGIGLTLFVVAWYIIENVKGLL